MLGPLPAGNNEGRPQPRLGSSNRENEDYTTHAPPAVGTWSGMGAMKGRCHLEALSIVAKMTHSQRPVFRAFAGAVEYSAD